MGEAVLTVSPSDPSGMAGVGYVSFEMRMPDTFRPTRIVEGSPCLQDIPPEGRTAGEDDARIERHRMHDRIALREVGPVSIRQRDIKPEIVKDGRDVCG